jgi:hypothetical protein
LINLRPIVLGVIVLAAAAVPASAQTWVNQNWSEAEQETSASLTAQLNRQASFNAAAEREFGPVVEFASDFEPLETGNPFAATTTRDIWREADGHTDRLRLRTRGELRRADGAPVPLTPMDEAVYDPDGYDLRYTRGWQVARGYTRSGLEVTLTPHAGFGVGDRGSTAEAGATLRIGSRADRILPEGSAAFGERARWYIYAAGSGTAVGYNFARTRDGEFARSGYSRDSGSFLGDASIGVALRKGDIQGSFGLVYREIEAEGMTGHGIDNDVSEGLVAFQLSIKPEW